MTLWESLREQLAKEMPRTDSHPRTWGGFVGASIAAAGIVAVWFPVRLVHEILKAIPTDAAPNHRAESEALFREAFACAAELPSPSEFAASVLGFVDLSPAVAFAFDAVLRRLYAESMMLDGDCREFRVRACIVGSMERPYGTTERAYYPGRDLGSATCWSGCQDSV